MTLVWSGKAREASRRRNRLWRVAAVVDDEARFARFTPSWHGQLEEEEEDVDAELRDISMDLGVA